MDKDVVKQIILPIVGVALFIITVGIYTKGQRQILPSFQSATPASYAKVIVSGREVKVIVVNSESERKKGLSVKNNLSENEGMLFVFDKKDVTPSFWMKDMSFAIDIIWINDGAIVEIDKNAQPPPSSAKDSDLTIYKPKEPIDFVLEVNAGFSNRNNIEAGDAVDLSNI